MVEARAVGGARAIGFATVVEIALLGGGAGGIGADAMGLEAATTRAVSGGGGAAAAGFTEAADARGIGALASAEVETRCCFMIGARPAVGGGAGGG